MVRSGKLLMVVSIVLLVAVSVITPVKADQSAASTGFLLHESESGLKFEVTFPWQELGLEVVTENGKQYTRVSLEGWTETGQAGAPLLPMLVQQAAIPIGADVELWVVPGEAHRIALSAPVLPVETMRVGMIQRGEAFPQLEYSIEEDAAVYAGGEYPGALAMVMNDGMLRQQRVIGLSIYPVQYDAAANELIVYESLEVELKYSGGMLSGAAEADSEVYEEVFAGELLNYESSQEMREAQGGMMMRSFSMFGAGASLPWTPPSPAWRVKVREDGFYRLSYVDLAVAGLPVTTLDPRTLKLYYLGQEMAIQVSGEGDGKLDSADSLLFYGQKVDSKYTNDNVYWITYGGSSGLRMGSRNGTVSGGTLPASFTAKRHYEENHTYYSNIPGAEELDRNFWMLLETYDAGNRTWQYTFNTPTRYSGVNAELRLKLYGAFNVATNPDHHVRVTLNGSQIGDARWDGFNSQEMVMSAPLLAGANTITVTLPNDTGAGFDGAVLDWLKVNFASNYVAEGDKLNYSTQSAGAYRYQLSGFTKPDIALYDVTDAWNVKEIVNASIGGSGPFTLAYSDTIGGESQYFALSRTLYKTVSGIEADISSNLQNPGNGADYILITPRAFWDAAGTLTAYRTGQGLISVRVDVQDIYDEFNYGIVSAAAIRSFLKYTYENWDGVAPSYVLLFGDGHSDAKYYLGGSKPNHIPPYLAFVDYWIGETAADNRYVMVSGLDTIPDMMLGRITVNTASEAAAYVNKIKAYEGNTPSDWQKQILMVADNDETGNLFTVNANAMATCCIPATHTLTKVYLGQTHTSGAAAKSAILSNINAGKFIVNYHGHGMNNMWAIENLLSSSDVNSMSNGSRMPIMLVMACYTGFYHDPNNNPNADAMAEVMTRTEGKGSIASWAATGMGVAAGHLILNEAFYNAYFTKNVKHLGEAVTAGNIKLWGSNNNLDLLDTMLLFGDPALQFSGTPTAVDLVNFSAESSALTATLNWESLIEVDNLGFNIYRAESVDGARIKVNQRLIRAGNPQGGPTGAVYSYQDTGAGLPNGLVPNRVYFYWLEDIDIKGNVTKHGPVNVVINP